MIIVSSLNYSQDDKKTVRYETLLSQYIFHLIYIRNTKYIVSIVNKKQRDLKELIEVTELFDYSPTRLV